MADQSFNTETYVDTAAALIGLPIAPAHRPGVVVNFERLAQMAAVVMEFPLPDGVEPAPVFRP
jgi:1-carboxybiuret hydrolase subunit AtzG-like